MTNDDVQGGTSPRPFSFAMPPFDPNRARRPSSFVGIPEDFLLLLGHVIGAWSQFDTSFNRFLGKLLATCGPDSDRWEMDSFKKRSRRLRQACQERFADYKSLLSFVDQLVADAKLLQTDRNLIVHGHILIKMQTFAVVDNQIQGALSLHCAGTESGKRLEREYSLEDLERVRYDFAHLCGRMNALSTGERLDYLQVTPSDTHALQSFLANTSRDSANQ